MPLSDAMSAKLNEQVTHEFFASQAYLASACYFAGRGLKGLEALFRKQTEEEREHALKILDFVLNAGGAVKLAPIGEPPATHASVVAAIEAALAHEQKVTRQIHELVALADKEHDYATRSFLQWFVDEQVEEVDSMSHLVQIAKLAGDNLLQLDAYVFRMNEAK